MEYIFTDHAIEQFITRSEKIGSSKMKSPVKTLGKLINQAVEESLPGTILTKRLISNQFKSVRYLTAQGWRFVISETDNVVITVERTDPCQN